MLFEDKYELQKKIILNNKTNNVNFLFYGYEDYGKEYVMKLLFDEKLIKRKNIKTFYIVNKNIEITEYYTSKYIELNLYEFTGNKDKLLKEIIKEFVTYKLIDNDINNIIIHGIEVLKKKEQFTLRKIIENASCAKFILFSRNIDTLIEPILSRCLMIKIDGFTDNEIKKIIPSTNVQKKFLKNDNNVKKTLLMIKDEKHMNELNIKIKKQNIDERTTYINKIIKFIKNKNINNSLIKKLNSNIFYLYTRLNMSHDLILYKIYESLYEELPDDYSKKIIEYDLKLKQGSKGEIHLESFIYDLKYFFN